jgi:DNA-binding response OmpR family regulator
VERIERPIILAIFPPGEDRTSLHNILGHSDWELQFTRTLEETQAALLAGPIAVVFAEGRLADGHCWKDILQELQVMSNPPVLIVADRLADDVLWAEVLNLGGHDLLTKPFNANEVLHAVATACHFGEGQRAQADTLRKPPNSAEHDAVGGIKQRAACGGQ